MTAALLAAMVACYVRRARDLARKQSKDSSIFNYIRRRSLPFHSLSKMGALVENSFQPRASDVIVTTYHKTGTTLLLHICHQIRTVQRLGRGSMAYPDSYFVTPWLHLLWELGIDPDADHFMVPEPPYNRSRSRLRDQHDGERVPAAAAAAAAIAFNIEPMYAVPKVRVHPRVFKSHRCLAGSYSRGRYIVSIRDPAQTLVSLDHFFKAKQMPGWPADSLEEATRSRFWLNPFQSGDIWSRFLEAWKARSHASSSSPSSRSNHFRRR